MHELASEDPQHANVDRGTARESNQAAPQIPLVLDGRLSQGNLSALQRLAGNKAVAEVLGSMAPVRAGHGAAPGVHAGEAVARREPVSQDPLSIQRAKFGSFFKNIWAKIKGLFTKKATVNATNVTIKEDTVAPVEERGNLPTHPPQPRPGFDLAGGQEILTKAFGDVKAIVPGKIEVLNQGDFEAAYDKIYGGGEYSWERYVKPHYGSLNGFAHEGVNYINKASAGLHTIVHEMLHNNAASDWIPEVGSRFNEGTTEILTQVACKLFDEPAPVCYPGESPVVQTALDSGLPLADLEAAYLVGGAKEKIADWVDAHCQLSWAEFKHEMESQNWAAAKAGLAPKSRTPEPVTTGSVGGTK